MVNQTALEFAQYVLKQNPKAKSFVAMYDAMSRAATFRSFRNLGREELARLGISFSLLATGTLELVIEEARMSLSDQNDENVRPVRNLAAYSVGVREASLFTFRQETQSSASGKFEVHPEAQQTKVNVQSNGVSGLPL